MKVSPEVGGGVQEQPECRQNKAQLIVSLQAELAELRLDIIILIFIFTIIIIIIRLDILRRRKDNLLEAPQPSSSRKTTEGGRTRASFVEYVSEVCSNMRLANRDSQKMEGVVKFLGFKQGVFCCCC